MEDIIMQAGQILNCKKEKTGIILKCSNANVSIQFYSAAIVRIEVSFSRKFDSFSYAVDVNPQSKLYNIKDKNNMLILTTSALKIEITKMQFAVCFKTLDGRIINSDEHGLYNSKIESTVTAYKTLQNNERFIGLGEKSGGLNKAGKGYTNHNTDCFGYSTNTDPLYATLPFYIGLHNGLCYGIFLDNTYQSDFNFGASNNRFSSFGARGGNLNYYFMHNTSVREIIESYTYLTGRMPLPPKWSLGYHQNRYSYYPDTEVLRIAQTLREKAIPCDSITLDIHYMDRYKPFTWDKNRFQNPNKLIDDLNTSGFKTTVIADPGVTETEAEPDIFLKYIDGTQYKGQVWPGWCQFPDFTNPEARKWWKQKLNNIIDKGVAGIWNDMNEIATWGNKMPDNILFHYEGQKASHLKARNIYGLQMARASYEGYVETCNNRPFILTRAAYSGIQKYSAVWTGDNTADDSHMLMGIRMLMSMGIAGVPFTGMDIGGFLGEPSPQLYARWMQLGAFIPYMRNHKQINTKSSESWSYGEEVMEISRNYINLRYQLMPYTYSLFRESAQTGIPIVRTLAIEHSFDDNIYSTAFENQFYFGDAFMIAPFDSCQKYGEVYFPTGNRYNLYNDAFERGENTTITPLSVHTLPVYVNESSIIPMQNIVQSTQESPSDTLYLHIYHGEKKNTFIYYEDDGHSFNYLSDEYYEREITYNPNKQTIELKAPTGKMPSKFTKIKLIFHAFDALKEVKTATKIKLEEEMFSFLSPISAFEPQSEVTILSKCSVKCCTIPNENSEIVVRLV